MVIRFWKFVTKLKQKINLVAMPRRSILHLNHSLFFVWSSLEHETCQLLEFVTINYFPFSMHFLCHTVMNFCERVGEITFVPYFFQENVLSERENFAAATIIFHFYMYLNDQRVEIYLLNWPNYLTFSFLFILLLFLRLDIWCSIRKALIVFRKHFNLASSYYIKT